MYVTVLSLRDTANFLNKFLWNFAGHFIRLPYAEGMDTVSTGGQALFADTSAGLATLADSSGKRERPDTDRDAGSAESFTFVHAVAGLAKAVWLYAEYLR